KGKRFFAAPSGRSRINFPPQSVSEGHLPIYFPGVLSIKRKGLKFGRKLDLTNSQKSGCEGVRGTINVTEIIETCQSHPGGSRDNIDGCCNWGDPPVIAAELNLMGSKRVRNIIKDLYLSRFILDHVAK